MTIKLYAFTCGTVTGEFAHLMEGGEGDITVPIPVFLIAHRNCSERRQYRSGRYEPRPGELPPLQHSQPGEEISARLEAIDRDPDKIDLIISGRIGRESWGGGCLCLDETRDTGEDFRAHAMAGAAITSSNCLSPRRG
jgi:N-acyl homoserine lactone hydrolase